MIKLGNEVKDPITGFIGIAVAKTEWLWGCIRIGIESKLDKDGKIIEIQWFDEPRLEIIGFADKPKKAEENKKPSGGPQRESSARRESSRSSDPRR